MRIRMVLTFDVSDGVPDAVLRYAANEAGIRVENVVEASGDSVIARHEGAIVEVVRAVTSWVVT